MQTGVKPRHCHLRPDQCFQADYTAKLWTLFSSLNGGLVCCGETPFGETSRGKSPPSPLQIFPFTFRLIQHLHHAPLHPCEVPVQPSMGGVWWVGGHMQITLQGLWLHRHRHPLSVVREA
nr:hypothetical protein Iba_chr07cCG10030 [Ipomoea batatas]